MPAAAPPLAPDLARLTRDIRAWAHELGFAEIGVADTGLAADETRLAAWLAAGRHGEMEYLARHRVRTGRPAELVPGTNPLITARTQYILESARVSVTGYSYSTLTYSSRYTATS